MAAYIFASPLECKYQPEDDVIRVLQSGSSHKHELFHVGIYDSSVPLKFPTSTMKRTKTDMFQGEEQLRDVIDCFVAHHAPFLSRSPIFYVVLEGLNLSRKGTATKLTMLVDIEIPERHIRLIDLLALAIQTAGVVQTTLREILQNEQILKSSFDVHNDSDPLFAHFLWHYRVSRTCS